MSPPRTRAARLAPQTYTRLRQEYPDATCALVHRDPFELLVAVVLSAQTTDVSVNRVMPGLLSKYPDAAALSKANCEEVEPLLRSIGMYHQKSRNIIALSDKLVREYQGEVPRSVADLITLPGVGRKTANVVLGSAFGIAEGIAVDTHVQRLSQRLGWTRQSEPVGIEKDLMALIPQQDWILVSHVLIFHGRRVCSARAPACDRCVVRDTCPTG